MFPLNVIISTTGAYAFLVIIFIIGLLLVIFSPWRLWGMTCITLTVTLFCLGQRLVLVAGIVGIACLGFGVSAFFLETDWLRKALEEALRVSEMR